MDTPTLLRELSTRGATVALEGESLRVQPSRVLDDALRVAIRAEKLALIELLREREYSQPDNKAAATGAACSSRVFDSGAAYCRVEAEAAAWEMYRAGEVTAEQRETLRSYARCPSR